MDVDDTSIMKCGTATLAIRVLRAAASFKMVHFGGTTVAPGIFQLVRSAAWLSVDDLGFSGGILRWKTPWAA